jgi:hypothetical protein
MSNKSETGREHEESVKQSYQQPSLLLFVSSCAKRLEQLIEARCNIDMAWSQEASDAVLATQQHLSPHNLIPPHALRVLLAHQHPS